MDKDILKLLNALGLEKKANEVMNSGLAGGGAELIPSAVLMKQVFEAVPQYGTFLGALPGFHGYDLDKSVDVPIIGMVDEFVGNDEWTTGALVPQTPDGTKLPTDEVNLAQKGFIKYIALSNDLLQYSRVGDIEAMIVKQLAQAAALTVESCVLNGDPDASGNVNYDGGTPSTSLYYKKIGVDGLRATAITAGDVHDAGTLDFADFATIQGLVGDYGSNAADCMWLLNRQTFQKALTIGEFAEIQKNGKSSTIYEHALGNILGSDYFIPKRLGLAQATGKVHYSTGNTKGQIVYFWKPAVQYGFGKRLEIGVTRVVGKGILITAAFDMALSIVSEKAAVTDPTVSMGVNITV